MRLIVIILVLSLGLGSCGDENEVPEVGPLRSTPLSSITILFYSISDAEGSDIFDKEDYNIDSLRVLFTSDGITEPSGENTLLSFGRSEMIFLEKDNMNLIGFQMSGSFETYYFDFGNGDIDTLDLVNNQIFNSFNRYSNRPLESGTAQFIFNGELAHEVELLDDSLTFYEMVERVETYSLNQKWPGLDNPYVISLIKQ